MPDYEKLLQYAFRILAKKRYTSFEMKRKLNQCLKRRKIEDLEIADSVLGRLLELKYLDDMQYVQDYVSDRIKFKPRGKFLLTKELESKGISQDLINQIFEKLSVDEYEIALAALAKREQMWELLPFEKKREKAFRFLSSRGFTPDAIYKIVKQHYNRGNEVESY